MCATIKQKEFVAQTIKTSNPTEAVRRVYDIGSRGGLCKNTASSIASENLRKPEIVNELGRALKTVDWAKHLRQTEEMADTAINEDKDNALKYKKMLFDLGDKFPAGKIKLGSFEERDKVTE